MTDDLLTALGHWATNVKHRGWKVVGWETAVHGCLCLGPVSTWWTPQSGSLSRDSATEAISGQPMTRS